MVQLACISIFAATSSGGICVRKIFHAFKRITVCSSNYTHSAIDLSFRLYNLAYCLYTVGWKKKIWDCWLDVFHLKSSFTCIWSTLFNDIEIFDKVILQLKFILLSIDTPRFCVCYFTLVNLPYISSIHKGFCLRQGISSPISDLTERLLLEERDPPATPQESLYEAPPFDEVRFLNFVINLDIYWS